MHRSPYRAILIALILAIGSFAVAACGSDDNNTSSSSAPAAGSTSTAAKPAGKAIKVGLVTDIGGLNDRSFNALANKGLRGRQEASSASTGRVLISKSNADYMPNLSTLAQQKYDLVIAVGFLMADATEKVAKKFPDVKFAIIDSSAAAMKSKPKNVEGLLFSEQEAGYLVGYLSGLYAKDNSATTIGSVGGLKIPPVDHYIAGYQAGRQGGQSGDQDAQRLLAGLRRPGEVQGDRARPDLQGLQGRVPGRRPVRPRRPRRGQGEERPGHRRRRRPGLPRPAGVHQRAEEGRRGRLQRDQGRPGRPVRRRHRHPQHGEERRHRLRQAQRGRREVRRLRSRRSRTRSPAGRSPTSRIPSSRHGERPRAARDHEALRRRSSPTMASTSTCGPARSTRCSGRTAPASRRS